MQLCYPIDLHRLFDFNSIHSVVFVLFFGTIGRVYKICSDFRAKKKWNCTWKDARKEKKLKKPETKHRYSILMLFISSSPSFLNTAGTSNNSSYIFPLINYFPTQSKLFSKKFDQRLNVLKKTNENQIKSCT